MLNLQLHKLLICRSILSDKIMNHFLTISSSTQNETLKYEIVSLLLEKAEELSLHGNILREYLFYLLTNTDNLASRISEATQGRISLNLHQIFLHDMEILEPLFINLPSTFLPTKVLDNYVPSKKRPPVTGSSLFSSLDTEWSLNAAAEAILTYYAHYGCGDIATYRAFTWTNEKGLVGIKHFESNLLCDIIGYDNQKKQLIDNTSAFLASKPANNVLLIGARGTGKSSTVKALANEFFSQGLRLVQITKPQLVNLPLIMNTLRNFASKKFILFIDDLSFEGFEVEYKYLKSAIEGGVESRPENVLIYTTSNRRHIIKETWHDRDEGQDELYRNDSINETISLSDRFGLIINYRTPNQTEYLSIIDYYLQKAGIILDSEELRVLGHRWEIEHSGRSGRTARQFVDYYLGHL